ncbi:hypothetical protein MMC12_002010 [Toensbergia leucococca]|nr:hypothetical protein [Toensbergia leucococca]
MASQAPRQPSITSNSTTSSRRPKSRASTASIQSASTQSSHRFQHASESVFQYPAQPTQASSLQFTPEEMITRSEKQLTNPNLDCVIDPSLQNHTSNGAPYGLYAHSHGHSSMNRPPLSQHPSFSENSKTKNFNENPPGERHRTNPYNAFDRVEILATEHSNENQSQDEATAGDGKKKKGSATSIANDQELRKLFRENQGQSLKEVSLQVLANDRGPKAEKTKQIFAMLW